jgi:Zn-dependent M16 (insulinase) family peptidase
MLELMGEMIQDSKLDDKKRLKDVIDKINSRLQEHAKDNGVGVAGTRLTSYFSERGQYQERTGGLSYTKFIANLAKNFSAKAPEIIANLRRTAALIFNKSNLTVGITCEEHHYQTFAQELTALDGFLGSETVKPQRYTFKPLQKNEGLVAASKVQYVLQGGNFRRAGHPYSGHFNVLSQILSKDFLYEKIRVQGGAYGAWSAFSSNGFAQFASYRDPNLKKTLASFAAIVEFLKHFGASEQEMTRYIIGAIAKLDHPLTPASRGGRALRYFLEGRTHEDVQRERDEVLHTKKADIQKLAQVVADILQQNYICVYGGEKKLAEHKQLFSGGMVPVVD